MKKYLPYPARLAARNMRRTVKKLAFLFSNYFAQINKRPIIILGNQKSGTSVIASLLGMSTGLSVSIDLRREIGKQYYLHIAHNKAPFRKLIARNRKDFSRDIVKEPNLALFYHDLQNYFPDAKYVMIIRDPRDNIRSILNRVNVPGNLEEIGTCEDYNIDPGFEIVLGPHWPCIKAMPHYVEQLAERWNYFCDIYTKNRNNMVLIRYEDFNSNKEESIIKLARSLGLEPKHSISAYVDRQYQSRGNREIAWDIFFGMKNLSKIEELCSSRMKVIGYS